MTLPTPERVLLPCPFCKHWQSMIRHEDDGAAFVECALCMARGPGHKDDAKAEDLWNRRADWLRLTDPARDAAHIANEWADAACNGLQWLRNVQDGTSVVQAGIDEMTGNIKRIRALWAEAHFSPTPSAQAIPDDIAHLLRFYSVATIEEVVRMQCLHIQRLQSKLPPARDAQPRNYREG